MTWRNSFVLVCGVCYGSDTPHGAGSARQGSPGSALGLLRQHQESLLARVVGVTRKRRSEALDPRATARGEPVPEEAARGFSCQCGGHKRRRSSSSRRVCPAHEATCEHGGPCGWEEKSQALQTWTHLLDYLDHGLAVLWRQGDLRGLEPVSGGPTYPLPSASEIAPAESVSSSIKPISCPSASSVSPRAPPCAPRERPRADVYVPDLCPSRRPPLRSPLGRYRPRERSPVDPPGIACRARPSPPALRSPRPCAAPSRPLGR